MPAAAALQELVADLRQAVTRAADAAPAAAAADLRGFAALLAVLPEPGREAASAWPDAPLARLPVCRFWDAALARAEGGAAAGLAAGLRTLGPALHWAQNPNYRRQPPDPGFLDNYGYAVLAGPAAGPRGLLAEPRLALGLLLLGPGTHYPLHDHPAVELYVPLSGDGEWRRGAGPWRAEPPGAVIHHASRVPHATRAGADPLLAFYLWRGDLATHAALVDS